MHFDSCVNDDDDDDNHDPVYNNNDDDKFTVEYIDLAKLKSRPPGSFCLHPLSVLCA